MTGDQRERGVEPHEFAAPQFSVEETRTLFEVLDVDGDLCDEAIRKLAMACLAASLQDDVQTGRLIAGLKSADPPHDKDAMRSDDFEPLRRFHAYRASDRALLDNPATIGKAMGENARRVFIRDGSRSLHPEQVLPRGGMVHAQLPHALAENEACLFSRSGSAPDALLHWRKFASEVDHVLKEHESLWGRLSTFFHRSNLISRWERTGPDWLDLYLQEGRRHWLLRIHFGGDDRVMLVIVSRKPGKPLQVPANDPHEFSMRLIDAFDGDVNPARFALTSVEQAIAASSKASLH